MSVVVTGAAGFIGAALSQALLDRGVEVWGLDNLNAYYDVHLKEARLARLQARKGFHFIKLELSDRAAVEEAFATQIPSDVTEIVHLAAQAGVRYSLTNPYAYVESNVMAPVILMERARHLPQLRQYIYASSSSVYGGNTKVPFALEDPVEKPISLYAATKRCDELMAYTYAHLYGIPATGLRFFTVYGPWGRPDMALYIFTKRILEGTPIPVFNNGNMRRDFTYIDDIIAGVLGVLDHPLVRQKGVVPTRLYNLGNSQTQGLMDYIHVLEEALGQKAVIDFQPLQSGDVVETYADIAASRRDLGFDPQTPITEGIPRFVAWYKEYHADAK